METGPDYIVTESRFVSLLSSGSEDGIKELYRQYGAALYGVAFRIVRNQETSEEILQEVFVKIWQNRDTYNAEKGRLYTWMLNITRNLAIDKLRSKEFKSGQKTDELDNSVHRLNQQFNHTPETDHIGLKELVDRLRPEQKELIDLVYFSGFTQAEASKKLKIPLGTVKTRIRSAVMELRRYFSE